VRGGGQDHSATGSSPMLCRTWRPARLSCRSAVLLSANVT
jgi:hypothetical protein